MARHLASLRVPGDTLLYPPDHRPRLPREYQFDLDGADGRTALRRVIAFLKERTAVR